MQVTLLFQWPAEAALRSLSRSIAFGEQNRLQIGRDPANDVHLDAPTVSRFHALVERLGQRYRVKDLDSANGTYVNEVRISVETWLQPGDSIRVGPYRFVLQAEALTEFDESGGLQLVATHLNKWVRKDLNILKDISLVFNPREFVVVVGQSGGGKSTLVDAIAGYRPATHGAVLVNGVNIYQHFDAIRDQIGFVPQKDIIHMELSVYQELDYAARLRMPADTSPAERHQRILEVLDNLDLAHRKDVQISGLSGGQQKRVSIGVEPCPAVFLDGLFGWIAPRPPVQLMRRLPQGRTIIMVTHATKNVMLADKVVFLARGGYLAWFGPPDEALSYFDQFRSEKDRRARPMEFDEIYAILDTMRQSRDWAKLQEHPAWVRCPCLSCRLRSQSAHQPSGSNFAPATPALPTAAVGGLPPQPCAVSHPLPAT
jgi:ABC-type multidrug transport system ATPase subunit